MLLEVVPILKLFCAKTQNAGSHSSLKIFKLACKAKRTRIFVIGEYPATPANKKRTFVYQKFLLLSKP